MGDVNMASREHYCHPPEYSRPLGSIWRCDECGISYVRWWNFQTAQTNQGGV